jgi:hypothetical protein
MFRNLLFVGPSMPRRQWGVKDYDDAICSAQQDLTNLAIENMPPNESLHTSF